MGQSQGKKEEGLRSVHFHVFCLNKPIFFQDTHTSGCAVVSLLLLLLPAAATSAAGADPPSDLSGPEAWPAMVLLKRRMLICSSSLSTTGGTGYCLVRPWRRRSRFKWFKRLAKNKCSIQFNFLTAMRRRLPCHFLAAAGVWRSLCGHTGPCSRAQGCSVTLPSPPACWGLPYLEPPDRVQTAFQHLAGESKSAFKDASHKNRLNYSFEFLSTKTHTLYRNGRYNKPHYDQNDLFCWFKQCNHVTNLKLTNEKRASIDVRSWRKKKIISDWISNDCDKYRFQQPFKALSRYLNRTFQASQSLHHLHLVITKSLLHCSYKCDCKK